MRVLLIGLFLSMSLYTFASEIDYLYLSGKVKKVKDDHVTLIIESGSCKGEKEFKISPEIKQELEKDAIITFQINSGTCNKKDKELTIIKIINKMKIKWGLERWEFLK